MLICKIISCIVGIAVLVNSCIALTEFRCQPRLLSATCLSAIPRDTPLCTADIEIDAIKTAVNTTFPEKGRPESRYIGKTIAAKFTQRSHLNVTFISSLAFFRNQLGVFQFNASNTLNPVVWRRMIFNDASEEGGTTPGCLRPGDTVTLGPFEPGVTLGFFLVNTNENKTFYSIEHEYFGKNSTRQTAWAYLPQLDLTVFSFEDRNKVGPPGSQDLADYDYNDVVFTFSGRVNTDEIPRVNDVPTQGESPLTLKQTANEPAPLGAIIGASAGVAAAALLGLLGFLARRKKKLTPVNAGAGLDVPMANNAQANPFYEGSTIEGANPVFRG